MPRTNIASNCSFFLFYHFQFVDYLLNKPLVVEVWGKQSGRKISRKETGGELNRPTANKKTSVGPTNSGMKNGEVVVRILKMVLVTECP